MQNYKQYFAEVVKAHYPDRYDHLMTTIAFHYKTIAIDTAFANTSANPIDKRLDFSAYFLALIKTLDLEGEKFETIRKICLEIVTEYVRPKNKIQQLLRQLPAKLTNTWLATVFIKLFNKKVSQNAHPDGFVANIITDQRATFGLGYGIDILECGICKLFNKHHYQKYASILCEVDEITSNLAGLKLIRAGTIANGAEKCDFRFVKSPVNQQSPGFNAVQK